jgi:hypothetical protein
VEAANHRDVSVPQVSRQVISLQDKVSGAADRAEEGDEPVLAQNANIAPGDQMTVILTGCLEPLRRVCRIARR